MINIRDKITELTGLEYKYNDSKMSGGDIMAPKGRLFKDVFVYDVKSFYPSIIMGYNVFGDKVTEFLLDMYERKNKGDKEAKLIMNKIYGTFKHFDINKAEEVTKLGRMWIKVIREELQKEGFEIIYSHTDSVMVCNVNTPDKALKLSKSINDIISLLKASFYKFTPLAIGLENSFKYIYFTKQLSKNKYIGVNYDESLVFKGIKPNLTEIKMIDFIKNLLNQGRFKANHQELMEYLDKYHKQTQRFINLNELSILEVETHKVNF